MKDVWNELGASWRHDDQALAVRLLLAQTKRHQRALRWKLALELVVSLAIVLFWLVMMMRNSGPGTIAMGLCSIAVVVVWLTNLWRNQRALWTAAAKTVEETMSWERARIAAALSWTTTLQRFCSVAAASVLVWGPLALLQGWEFYQAAPWRFAFGIVGYLAILVGVWRHAARQRVSLSTLVDPE
jgi:hypothetical protein